MDFIEKNDTMLPCVYGCYKFCNYKENPNLKDGATKASD